jgi:aspartokinase
LLFNDNQLRLKPQAYICTSKKQSMKVMKFGGTSVGKPERMHDVANLITRDGEEKIVVLSAVSGTYQCIGKHFIAIGQRRPRRSQAKY